MKTDLMKVRKRFGATVFFCFILCLPEQGAFGQTWSVEQKEVLATIEQMRLAVEAKDIDRFMSFVHKDFSGWGTASTLPTDREFRKKSLLGVLKPNNEISQVITPLAVIMHGDASVVHSHVVTILKSKETGQEQTRNTFWTDVYVREGGRWFLIADHGRLLE